MADDNAAAVAELEEPAAKKSKKKGQKESQEESHNGPRSWCRWSGRLFTGLGRSWTRFGTASTRLGS